MRMLLGVGCVLRSNSIKEGVDDAKLIIENLRNISLRRVLYSIIISLMGWFVCESVVCNLSCI